MNELLKKEISDGFPQNFEKATLGISISEEEFAVFQKGVFSTNMDEKWDAFVWGEFLYFSRSWTKYCIYKISTEISGDQVLFKDVIVNRDQNQFNSTDIEGDKIQLKKLIQSYLKRDDLYSDPKLELPLIKETIDSGNYHNYIKSIGSNNVGITRNLYQTLVSSPNTDFFDIQGWDALKKNLSDKSDNEPLISLYIQHKQNKTAKTFYFDKNVNELLGEIVITRKI